MHYFKKYIKETYNQKCEILYKHYGGYSWSASGREPDRALLKTKNGDDSFVFPMGYENEDEDEKEEEYGKEEVILIDYYPSFLAGNMLYENIVEKSFEENGFNDMFAICSVSQSETLPNGFTAAEALCPNPLKEIISLDELKQNENLTIYIDFRVYNEKFSQDFYKAYYEMYKQLKEFKCNFYITGYFAKSKIDTEYNLGSTMETNYKGDLCFSENLHCTVSANSFKNIKSVEDIAARAEMPSTND